MIFLILRLIRRIWTCKIGQPRTKRKRLFHNIIILLTKPPSRWKSAHRSRKAPPRFVGEPFCRYMPRAAGKIKNLFFLFLCCGWEKSPNRKALDGCALPRLFVDAEKNTKSKNKKTYFFLLIFLFLRCGWEKSPNRKALDACALAWFLVDAK